MPELDDLATTWKLVGNIIKICPKQNSRGYLGDFLSFSALKALCMCCGDVGRWKLVVLASGF